MWPCVRDSIADKALTEREIYMQFDFYFSGLGLTELGFNFLETFTHIEGNLIVDFHPI